MAEDTDSLYVQFAVVGVIAILLFLAGKYRPSKHNFSRNLSTSALIILTGLFSSIKIDPPEHDKVVNIREEPEDYDPSDPEQ